MNNKMLGGRRGNNGGGVRDTNYGVSGRPKAVLYHVGNTANIL